MNGYQCSPYGASPMHAPYNRTAGTKFPSMQTNDTQTQYSSISGLTSPYISHSPSSRPVPVPYHRPQESDRYQQPSTNTNISGTGIQNDFSRTQISTKYFSPNSNDSTSLLNLPHTDDSRERHVPHLVEGVYNSPPHTSDPASLEPPNNDSTTKLCNSTLTTNLYSKALYNKKNKGRIEDGIGGNLVKTGFHLCHDYVNIRSILDSPAGQVLQRR